MIKRLVILLLLVAAMLFTSPVAQACNNCGGYGGWGWGYDIGYLYNTLSYNVPYFAAFPPVYYSYPVPRTYGYSPFAYPPGVMTPDVVADAAPLEIINPYVPNTKDAATTQADKTAGTTRQPQPLVVLNPYVSQRSVAQSSN